MIHRRVTYVNTFACHRHLDVSVYPEYADTMNITSMLKELQAAGLSQRDIAERVGSTQTTIWRHTQGRSDDVRLSLGLAIMELHERICGEKLDEQSYI